MKSILTSKSIAAILLCFCNWFISTADDCRLNSEKSSISKQVASVPIFNHQKSKTYSGIIYSIATQKIRYSASDSLLVRYSIHNQSNDSAFNNALQCKICEIKICAPSGTILYTSQMPYSHLNKLPENEGLVFPPCNLGSFTDSLIISARIIGEQDSQTDIGIFVYRPKE